MKTYVVGTQWKHLSEVLPISTHSICFARRNKINISILGMEKNALYGGMEGYSEKKILYENIYCGYTLEVPQ